MGISVMKNNNIFNLEMGYFVQGKVDKDTIKNRLERFHVNADLISNGNYHKIRNLTRDNSVECWEVVSKDKSQVILMFTGVTEENKESIKRIKLKGLDEDATYKMKETNEIYSGGSLMHLGVNIVRLNESYSGDMMSLKVM